MSEFSPFDYIRAMTRAPGAIADLQTLGKTNPVPREPQISVGEIYIRPERPSFFDWIQRVPQSQWPQGMRPGGNQATPTFGHTNPQYMENDFYTDGTGLTPVQVQSPTTPEQTDIIQNLVDMYEAGREPPTAQAQSVPNVPLRPKLGMK